MKRMICAAGMVLVFVSMVLAGCASMTPLTTTNISLLTGQWQGWTTFDSFPGTKIKTIVEFKNSTIPLQGSITFTNITESAGYSLPGILTTSGRNVIEFSNGRISDKGTIIAGNSENFAEINYYGGDKPKLAGWFYYMGARGTLSVIR